MKKVTDCKSATLGVEFVFILKPHENIRAAAVVASQIGLTKTISCK